MATESVPIRLVAGAQNDGLSSPAGYAYSAGIYVRSPQTSEPKESLPTSLDYSRGCGMSLSLSA
jgi:hypothetical protein